MAFWEWIPFASTVGHALADPPGRSFHDYIDCAMTETDCVGSYEEIAAARLVCQKCIDDKMRDYVAEWMFSGAPSDVVGAIGGATLAKFAESLSKLAAKRIAPRLAAVGTGVGAALALDGVVDIGIQLSKAADMWSAAHKAKQRYCQCA